jgi:hypothetical protein
VASSSIGLVLEELLEQMRLFGIQIRDFPKPPELLESQGAESGAAAGFYRQMEGLSFDLRDIATAIHKELEATEVRVRAAARDMAETDAAAADTARKLLEQLEGIAAEPAPVAKPGASNGAATGGFR